MSAITKGYQIWCFIPPSNLAFFQSSKGPLRTLKLLQREQNHSNAEDARFFGEAWPTAPEKPASNHPFGGQIVTSSQLRVCKHDKLNGWFVVGLTA